MPGKVTLITLCLFWAYGTSALATTLQCAYVPQLFDIYLKYHYSQKSLSEELKVHTTEQFIKSLDPSKTMLLESDVETLRANLGNVFTTMKAGTCGAIEDSGKLILQKANENLEFVKTFLDKNYKLDETATITLAMFDR